MWDAGHSPYIVCYCLNEATGYCDTILTYTSLAIYTAEPEGARTNPRGAEYGGYNLISYNHVYNLSTWEAETRDNLLTPKDSTK